MELAFVVRRLLAHRRLLLAAVLVAALAAVLSVRRVELHSPWLTARTLQYSAASTEAYVDTPDSLVADIGDDVGPNVERATIYANLMASPGGMALTGRYAGIPGDEIWAAGPVDPFAQRVAVEPTATKRATQIVGEAFPYRVELLTDPNLPVIWIYTQAPTTTQAVALANGSVAALRAYVRGLEASSHTGAGARVVIRQLGPATGGVVNGGITVKLAGLVFLLALLGGCVLILVWAHAHDREPGVRQLEATWRRA